MIGKVIQKLIELKAIDRIPKLPRGLYTSHFETFTDDERRVLARLGARDPLGINRVLKRYKVATVKELILLLEHQHPRPHPLQRLKLMFGRVVGGFNYDPHKAEIVRATRAPTPVQRETLERLERWKTFESD